MGASVQYLSTLSFSQEWLDELGEVSPLLSIDQISAQKAADVPDEMWRNVEVLHTSTVFPDPAGAPRLTWIQLDTSGADHVQTEPVWRSSVQITTIGGVSPVPLAEYVLFMVLGFAHRLPAMLTARDSHEWPSPEQRWERFLPAVLDGTTIGIIGYGRIGRRIGKLARAHGMSVLGLTRTAGNERSDRGPLFGQRAEHDSTEVMGPDRLHELLARSDYVVVMVPLTERTHGMLDAAALAWIRPGAVLINAARGGIVEENALLAGLRSGRIRGAALDVFDDEPLPPHSPWWTEPNVMVTPHISGLAGDYHHQVRKIVTENLRHYLAGEPLLNSVDRTQGY